MKFLRNLISALSGKREKTAYEDDDSRQFYNYTDSQWSRKLELAEIDELKYEFVFTNNSLITPDCSFKLSGQVTNIDPDGDAELDIFDPEGEFRPTEVYDFEDKTFKIQIAIPLEESPVVGVKCTFYQDNPCNITEVDVVLRSYPPPLTLPRNNCPKLCLFTYQVG